MTEDSRVKQEKEIELISQEFFFFFCGKKKKAVQKKKLIDAYESYIETAVAEQF